MADLNSFNYTDDVDDVLAIYVNNLLASTMRSEYKNVETLSADRTLTDADTPLQRLDCNGAVRIVKVPTADAVENHPFFVVNSSSGAYAITLKSNDAATILATVAQGESVLVLPDGNGTYKTAMPINETGWMAAPATWTYYNRTQAYTNDPAAGANITLNMASTTGFVVGDIVQVSSSAGSENAMITTVVANTSITVNILELNHTTSSPLVTSLGKFTISGDYSAVFTKGTRVKWTQTTVKYGTVLYSSHSGGTTTVSISINSDYTITNAAISANYYSYLDGPRDWPEWFNFSPGQIGFSAKPTNTVYRYSLHGKKMALQLRQTPAGTSNATSFVMGLPVMAATVTNMAWMSSSCIVDDNSIGLTTPGLMTVASAGAVLNVYKDQQLAGFTAAGGKRLALGNIVYEC